LDIFLEMAMTALPYVTKAVGVFYSALFGLFTFVQQAGGGFIKVLKGIGTLNFDMAKEGIDQIQSSFSKAVKAGEDAYKRFEVGSKELTKSEKEELEKRQKAADEAAAKKKAAAAKADAKKKAAAAKADAAEVKRKEEEAAKLKAIEDKRLADDMKSAEDAVNILNRLREATETPAQKLQREYEEEKLVLEANNLSTEELTRQHLAKLAAIKTTEETTQAEKDRVAREKKLADETALNDQLIAVEIAYQDAKRGALDTGLNILLMFAGKNKALALSILAVQKGLAIADVVVGAARSISLATQNLAQIPMVLPPGIPNPAFYVQAAATVKGIATTKITAATSIASILAAGISQASSISGGSGGGGAAAGGGGGGMAAPAPQAQFNIVGQSSNNQLAGAIATQQQQPVQAFVVGSDVTTQQALDRQKINNSTFL
jgi:chemotaxis protein histidine kinase CheA